MRNGNSHISVVALSAHSPWHSSWIGRIILAALLIAVSALALMPDRTSAHHTPNTTYETHCQSSDDNGILLPDLATSAFISDCIALLKAAEKLTVGDDTNVNWLERDPLPLLTHSMGENFWNGVSIEQVGEAPNQEYRITRVDLSMQDLSGELAPEWARADRIDIPGPLKQWPEWHSFPVMPGLSLMAWKPSALTTTKTCCPHPH